MAGELGTLWRLQSDGWAAAGALERSALRWLCLTGTCIERHQVGLRVAAGNNLCGKEGACSPAWQPQLPSNHIVNTFRTSFCYTRWRPSLACVGGCLLKPALPLPA